MSNALYENINKATYDFPHMEFNSQNLTYISHFHNEIEIAYLVKGYSTVFCDNRKIDASEGDLFIFMPGQIHSFLSTEPNLYYIFKLRCENDADGTDFSTLRTANMPIDRNCGLYRKLIDNINESKEEFERNNIGNAYFLNSIANRMVGEILRYGNISVIEEKEDIKTKYNAELLAKVNAYISDNYREKIVIADIAKHCRLSEYYFAHIFKEITGATFFDHLTVFRLERTIEVHMKTGKALTDAAFECGFTNVRSFYRLFKKHYKVTPKEYISKTKAK